MEIMTLNNTRKEIEVQGQISKASSSLTKGKARKSARNVEYGNRPLESRYSPFRFRSLVRISSNEQYQSY